MMTVNDLIEIARDAGLSHAEYCLEQYETQAGSDTCRELWDELNRMVWLKYTEWLEYTDESA